jgi:hypothetical protein
LDDSIDRYLGVGRYARARSSSNSDQRTGAVPVQFSSQGARNLVVYLTWLTVGSQTGTSGHKSRVRNSGNPGTDASWDAREAGQILCCLAQSTSEDQATTFDFFLMSVHTIDKSPQNAAPRSSPMYWHAQTSSGLSNIPLARLASRLRPAALPLRLHITSTAGGQRRLSCTGE